MKWKINSSRLVFYLLSISLTLYIVLFLIVATTAYIYLPNFLIQEVDGVVNMPCWQFLFYSTLRGAWFLFQGGVIYYFYRKWKDGE